LLVGLVLIAVWVILSRRKNGRRKISRK
jgi:hypothetical protein